MRLNERQRRWLIENDLLLENSNMDGSLATIMNKVAGPLKEFGEVFKASIKLVMVDVNYLLTLSIGSFLLFNSEERKKLKEEKNKKRNTLLQTVGKGWSTVGLDSDQKFMMCMLNPAAFFGGLGLKEVALKPFDPDWRTEMGEMGFDQLPIIGRWFDTDFRWESEDWKKITDAKDLKTAMAELDKSITGQIKKHLGGKEETPGGDTTAGIPNTALALFGLFLLGEADSTNDSILLEADDDEKDSKKKKESKKDDKEVEPDYDLLRKYIEIEVNKHVKIEGDKLIKMKKEEMDSWIGDIPQTIEGISILSAAKNPKEFFGAMNGLVKLLGEKAKKFDEEKIKSAFEKAKEDMKGNEEAMKKLKDQFAKEKIKPTEETVNARLEEIVLDGIKGGFLPKVKETLGDILEEVHTQVWDGLTKKQLKLVGETKTGQAYIALCKEYEGKIQKGLSKLKQG